MKKHLLSLVVVALATFLAFGSDNGPSGVEKPAWGPGSKDTPPPATTLPPTPPATQRTLYVAGQKELMVASGKEELDELLGAANENNTHLIARLVLAGKVFLVPNGTRVRIVDWGMFSVSVKIQLMEGEDEGRTGYVPMEWVTPRHPK